MQCFPIHSFYEHRAPIEADKTLSTRPTVCVHPATGPVGAEVVFLDLRKAARAAASVHALKDVKHQWADVHLSLIVKDELENAAAVVRQSGGLVVVACTPAIVAVMDAVLADAKSLDAGVHCCCCLLLLLLFAGAFCCCRCCCCCCGQCADWAEVCCAVRGRVASFQQQHSGGCI